MSVLSMASVLVKRLIKEAGKEIVENDKSASCFEKAGSKLLKNPVGAIGDFGKCIIGEAVDKRVRRRRK